MDLRCHRSLGPYTCDFLGLNALLDVQNRLGRLRPVYVKQTHPVTAQIERIEALSQPLPDHLVEIGDQELFRLFSINDDGYQEERWIQKLWLRFSVSRDDRWSYLRLTPSHFWYSFDTAGEAVMFKMTADGEGREG